MCKLQNENTCQMTECPEGFTYELMYEIEREFERKMGEDYENIDILAFIERIANYQ